MPKKPESQEQPVEEKLVPFSVIIDGQDRTVFARDMDDLQQRLSRLSAIPPSSPTNDGQ